MTKPTLGSLFDGIGGFPLSAVYQGFNPLWASEIEPFSIRVTKMRLPQMLHVGDIKKLHGANLPIVDVIAGGSPCQDLSTASGQRVGLAGERSGLFMEQIRLVKEMRCESERASTANVLVRPRYLLWENVPGAFSSTDGEDFHAVLEETARIVDNTISIPRPTGGLWKYAGCILGRKFSIAWRVLDAQYWFLAQRRRRIFLVADFAGHTAPQILFEQNSLLGDFTPSQKTMQGITPCFEKGLGDTSGDFILPLAQPLIFDNHGNDCRYNGPLTVAPTIASTYGTGGNNVPLLTSDKSYCIAGNIIDRQDHNGGNGCGFQSDISYTLTATDVHAVYDRHSDANLSKSKVFGQSQYGNYAEGCSTLRAQGGDNGGGSENLVAITEATKDTNLVRRLTPLECERLMGFPDGWTNIPKCTDSARYKALGNSVAIPCVEFILRGIVYFLQRANEE